MLQKYLAGLLKPGLSHRPYLGQTLNKLRCLALGEDPCLSQGLGICLAALHRWDGQTEVSAHGH